MKATVKVINPQKGLCAAEIDGLGDYVIFKLLDSAKPEVGDAVVLPEFVRMGKEVFDNITQKGKISVFVENVCNAQQAQKQCQ